MSGLNEIKNEINFWHDNHKNIKLTKTLIKFLRNLKFSVEEKSDIIGELNSKSVYFMDIIYPRLQAPVFKKWKFSD